MVGRAGIETMLYLLDEAFRGAGIEASNESQALMPNLRSVPDVAWHAMPRANGGEDRETRWLIAAMISHDAYHAGEINHLRSLLGDDDRWRFQQLGFG